MKTYNLLVMNIDKLFLEGEAKASKKTKMAMAYLEKKQVSVVLVTNHSFSYAKKIARNVKCDATIIAHGGSFISDTDQNEWYNRPLSLETTLDLCHVMERFDCEVKLQYGDYCASIRPQHKQTLLARMSFNAPGEQILYPLTYVDSLYEHVLKEGKGPLNVSLKCDEQKDLDYICEIVKQEIPELNVMKTNKGECFVVGAGAEKERALQWLVKRNQLSLDQVIVVGVGEEDSEMIAMAGLGVAMGDATESVKEKANWVTRTMNQGGLAYMVHEVFRKQLNMQLKE
ncbi:MULTISPECIES: HAD-IIB family hydrolase [Shouchella]|uniref:HAD-IIB family hydrolase n=2 Tax=Shouchella TaxID=2893057 RepID=A0ABY7W1J2_9BACI|nr:MULTISPECIES: HAD-IIB family hydrolase [Shouchella]MED4129565.1 HAD-IIB family hydrolase [Shouchella miscanthi]WDF02825.1 HAD-IIB family hydrolase [Shouchella hunanensis]GAF22282.1 hydrolase [Bacillus sp. JCM 19047]